MKKVITSIIIWGAWATAAHASLTFTGATKPVFSETPPASTGLTELYVVNDTQGVAARYEAASSSETVRWYRFGSLGGGYAEEIEPNRSGATSWIDLPADDLGLIIEAGQKRYYYWIVDYAKYYCHLNALAIDAEQECDVTTLCFDGSADRIPYYTINGVQQTLSRGLELAYNTLEYDEEAQQFQLKRQTQVLSMVTEKIHAQAPLCDTDFELSGDRFLTFWGEQQSVVSPTFQTQSVDARTTAEQTSRKVDNEQKVEGGALGGSAPVEITFKAATTDAVVYREWQLTRDQTFTDIDLRFNDDEFSHTFRDAGSTYVRFICANATGTCDYYGEVYTVYVGDSKIDCPNAFSPGASEGVNDEWRVSYKSIIEFDCHIFNRWGVEVAHLTDPAQGWDGRHNGKLVPTGAYYYVITATGADGHNYKLSGDINILRYKGQTAAGAE